MERSPEIRDLINGWFEAVARGDAAWVERHVSPRAAFRLVGTDPAEMLAGEQGVTMLREEAQALGGQVSVAHGATEAYREGAVGWGLANPTITLPNGKSFSPRWSAVLHQEDGAWKFIQIHASVGVPNEQLLG